MNKQVWLWILAIVITASAAIYQRTSDPAYEKEVHFQIENKEYTTVLPKRHSGTDSCAIELPIPASVEGVLFYKKYSTDEDWKSTAFRENETGQIAYLPGQPPAAKLQYFIGMRASERIIYIARNDPLVIHFRGEAPTGIQLPHMITMVLTMLFSTIAGLFALGKIGNYRIYGYITLILLIIGGFILEAAVQYYTSGNAWTGIPFGWNLTDNKTLIAFIGWTTAVLSNRKKSRPRHYVIAALLLLIVYSIPNSLPGS